MKSAYLSLFKYVFLGTVLAISTQAIANNAPYEKERYRSVLDDSKLQAPTSSTLIKQGQFVGQANQYFFMPTKDSNLKADWMTFSVKGNKKRSELRQMQNWFTSSTTHVNKMIAELVVNDPINGDVDEITFMQVHDVTAADNAINKPLVRLVWERKRGKIENHYWAVIKEDACRDCKNYAKIDLGAYSDKATKFEIRIQNNQLTVKVNNKTHPSINRYDVSYWGELESYFKAGVYNQSSGRATVQFKRLKYYQQAL